MENESLAETTKMVTIEPKTMTNSKKVVKTEKDRVKRVVVDTDRWQFAPKELEMVYQREMISNMRVEDRTDTSIFVLQQIRSKISGYKSQDKEKTLFSPEKFIKEEEILERLKQAELMCYYCQEGVFILYEYVREPKQWTLERLDNKHGHNSDNVVIACLECNLRRRCIHFERYLQTKQLKHIVKVFT